MELSENEDNITYINNYGTYNIDDKLMADIKFPTFDDSSINSQLKFDITYDTLINDLNSSIDSISHFIELFKNLILENKNNILNEFTIHDVNYIDIKAYLIILKRHLILLSYMVKIIFKEAEVNENENEKNDLKYFNNIIQDEYANSDQLEQHILVKIINEDVLIKNEKNEKLKSNLNEIISKSQTIEQYLLKSFISNKKDKFKPSITGLSILLKIINSSLTSGSKDIDTLNTNNKVTQPHEVILDFFNILTKIEIFISLIPLAFKINENDLFNLKENSAEWCIIKEHYIGIIPHSSHTMKKKLLNLFTFVSLGSASIYRGHSFKNKYLKFIGTGYFMAYFFFNKHLALLETKKFSIKPDVELSRRVWNLLDTKGIKHGYKRLLSEISAIKYREKLYVKKTENPITLEFIKKTIVKLDSKLVSGFESINEDNNNYDFTFNLNNLINSDKSGFSNHLDYLNTGKGELLEKSITKDTKSNYVKIKLLSSNNFHIPKYKSKWRLLFTSELLERNYTRNALIVHIHGGGFVAMSSSSHENYLRKWCNKLEVPIISIDYGLSPENPFPKPLDDVWQAYNWIINHASRELNINLEKIILIGDSAGGNLAMALVNLLIINNKRLPDAVFLAYPALRICDDFYSPSFLLSLSDTILTYPLLKYCLQAYRQTYDKNTDPFLSPIFTNDYLLSRFPPVRIILGSADPLRDDSFRLLKRLLDLNKDAKLTEFKYFPHGFLSYDLPFLLPQASVANEYMINEIEKFLSK